MRSLLSGVLLFSLLGAEAYSQPFNDDAVQTSASGSSHSSSSVASPSPPSPSTVSLINDLIGQTGDVLCTELLCISAAVNSTTASYVLQSTNSQNLGWLAMGFGTQMSNAAMIIMWPNSDGSVTLSQRSAPGEQMPTVASNPPRQATLSSSLTNNSNSFPRFGYTIPVNSDTEQNIIWAFSSSPPSSNAADAPINIHTGKGTLKLDLAKPITSANASTFLNPVSFAVSGSGSVSTAAGPYTKQQRIALAHGIFAGVSFLVFLPFGALLARFARTFTGRWFAAHWIVQFGITAPMVAIALALGIAAVSVVGGKQLYSTHEKLGVAIIVLYAVQCALGGIIHFVKPAPKPGKLRKRPIQNYGHAVLGLLTIALSFYQARTGYRTEWPVVGRGPAPSGVNTAWIVWVIVLPLLYIGGLALLPRQYRLEHASSTAALATAQPNIDNDVPLTPLSATASAEDVTLRSGERTTRYDSRRFSVTRGASHGSRPGSSGMSLPRLSSFGRPRSSDGQQATGEMREFGRL